MANMREVGLNIGSTGIPVLFVGGFGALGTKILGESHGFQNEAYMITGGIAGIGLMMMILGYAMCKIAAVRGDKYSS